VLTEPVAQSHVRSGHKAIGFLRSSKVTLRGQLQTRAAQYGSQFMPSAGRATDVA